MNRIVTLTVNPTIDKSTTVAGIRPDSKLRCDTPIYEAGGGGINISKVLKELGSKSTCIYMAGGPSGMHLRELLVKLDISLQIITIQGCVRENLAVMDTVNNQQYRFGMPGPMIAEAEWQKTLNTLKTILLKDDLLIASGSLSPGMPIDFYGRVSKIAKEKKAKYILDTSGEALWHGAKTGAYLLKPNLGELASLCGLATLSFQDLEKVARTFLNKNPCEVMVVSLGARGALLFEKNSKGATYIAAPIVPKNSTIGAGDSMVAGMAFALAGGKSVTEMAKFGVACGAAATMTEGTQLCKKKDVDELYQWILSNAVDSKNIPINA